MTRVGDLYWHCALFVFCRGQESAGIVTGHGDSKYKLAQHKGMGLVGQIFTDTQLHKLKGSLGIGNIP